MNIQFGNIVLEEWFLDKHYLRWCRDGVESENQFIMVEVLYSDCYKRWVVAFYGALGYLSSVYCGPESFHTARQSKDFVDNFLIRMNNLRAFI